MQVARKSILGGTHTLEIDVTQKQLDDWKSSGMLIQDAFPELTPEEREFLLTGITPEQWDAVFGSDVAL